MPLNFHRVRRRLDQQDRLLEYRVALINFKTQLLYLQLVPDVPQQLIQLADDLI